MEDLLATAKRICASANWKLQRDAGIDLIPSNDFSLYDQVLDTIALVGRGARSATAGTAGDVDLDTYFAMARGRQTGGVDVTAMEMTKWFDTNYHYIVPELGPRHEVPLSSRKPFDEHAEAKELGHRDEARAGRPAHLPAAGQVGRRREEFDRLELLDALVDVYAEVHRASSAEQGAEWVQIDEPVLVEDRSAHELDALERAYKKLAQVHERAQDRASRPTSTTSATPTGVLRACRSRASALDFVVRARLTESASWWPQNVEFVATRAGSRTRRCSPGSSTAATCGSTTSSASLDLLDEPARPLPATARRLDVCSLLHSPVDMRQRAPDARRRVRSAGWRSPCRSSTRWRRSRAGLDEGREAIAGELDANDRALEDRRNSPRTRNPEVRERSRRSTDADARRAEPVRGRAARPSTSASACRCSRPRRSAPSRRRPRSARRARGCARARSTTAEYTSLMRGEIERVIRLQEEIGLDVLVHGEPERNDMVQYFAEQMDGYVFTENAWVQSYGSRYVRPPIIFGDVVAPERDDGRTGSSTPSRSRTSRSRACSPAR